VLDLGTIIRPGAYAADRCGVARRRGDQRSNGRRSGTSRTAHAGAAEASVSRYITGPRAALPRPAGTADGRTSRSRIARPTSSGPTQAGASCHRLANDHCLLSGGKPAHTAACRSAFGRHGQRGDCGPALTRSIKSMSGVMRRAGRARSCRNQPGVLTVPIKRCARGPGSGLGACAEPVGPAAGGTGSGEASRCARQSCRSVGVNGEFFPRVAVDTGRRAGEFAGPGPMGPAVYVP